MAKLAPQGNRAIIVGIIADVNVVVLGRCRMSATNPAQTQHENPQATTLDMSLWHGSFNGRESTIQQLSPYIGKMKSGMAKVLIDLYSDSGDIVLDSFCGSGVVPFGIAGPFFGSD